MSSELEVLPEGWELGSIADSGEYINGFAFKPEHRSESGFPIIRIQNLTNENKPIHLSDIDIDQTYKVDDGDILVSWSATLDTFIWRRGPALVNQHIFKVVPETKLIEKKLLFYWLKIAIKDLQKTEHLHGSTMKHINRAPFMAHSLPFPPRNEQTRIVEKLEELLFELDNGVAKLKTAQKKLNQYRQSLLKSAVEGTLTEQWRSENSSKITETGEQLLQRILKERRQRWEDQKQAEFKAKDKKPPKDWKQKYPEPVQPDTSELPELPEGWVWASVEQCTISTRDITDGPFGSNLKTSHYTDLGPRVIRLKNIGDGIFNDDKAHISEEHFQSLLKHSFEAGDTLVAMMGEELPRACLTPEGVAPGVVKADCARVRVNSKILKPDLLPNYLNSQTLRLRTKSLVKGIGRPRINLSHIRGTPVPIASKEEQSSILHVLRIEEESIVKRISDIELALCQSEAQRKNILKDAFSGKLVEQNPSDEPASVLLEKIRAERIEQAKQFKPKRPKKRSSNKVATMKTLSEVLNSQTEWMGAQKAFELCGVTKNTSTDRIEFLYLELRDLLQSKLVEAKRDGSTDTLRWNKEQ